MSGLSRWGSVGSGPFRFGERDSPPLRVTVVARVVEPGTAGPEETGEGWVRLYEDGQLVSEEHTEAGGDS